MDTVVIIETRQKQGYKKISCPFKSTSQQPLKRCVLFVISFMICLFYCALGKKRLRTELPCFMKNLTILLEE